MTNTAQTFAEERIPNTGQMGTQSWVSNHEHAPDLLETLEVLTQLGVQSAGGQLCEAPVPEVLLPAKET